MSSGSYTPRGRGRGFNVNNADRNSNGNYGNRGGSEYRSSPGDSNRSSQSGGSNRGGYNGNRGGSEYRVPRENYNRRGQGGGRGQNRNNNNENRNNNSEIRNKTDPSLISSQNVQWNYDKSKIGLVKPEFVKRKEHLTDKFGRKIQLMTNHFSFRFASEVNIYLYNFSWLYKEADEEKPKTKKLFRDDCYKLFDSVINKYSQYFKSASVGYDGNTNVYLPYRLDQVFNELPVPSIKVDGKSYDFNVSFTLTKVLPLSVLSEYYTSAKTHDNKRQESIAEVIQALHIILKFPSRNNMISLGRLAMFPIDGERYYLSNWMQLALGHRKSIRFSEIGLTLVVDRASAAFLKSGDAVDFIKYIFNIDSLSDFKIRPDTLSILRKTFSNVKIATKHLNFIRKYDVKGITDKVAGQDSFKLNENGTVREVTVAQYFVEKHNVKLKYPNLPCIITTNGSKIPIEACKIVRNQSLQSVKRHLTAYEQKEMINQTATAPNERFTCLLQAHQQICKQVNEALPDFKINIGIKPIGLEGIVLGAPSLLYQGKVLEPKETRSGAWNLQGKIFYKTKTFENFGVLDFCGSGEKEREFRTALINKALEMKMLVRRDPRTPVITLTDYDNKDKNSERNRNFEKRIKETLMKMKANSCAFALCIFPEDKWVYNLTKRVADTVVHFPTQGVAKKNVWSHPSHQTIANILAKINKKLGGVNVILKEDEKPVLLKKKIMIIGADVTHPGEADELLSSVAASVSTYDSDHTMFYPSVRVQPKKNAEKKTVEIIKDFKSMVTEHLKNYQDKNKRLPEIILYLRDGVSEGQYSQILNEEVVHLKNPCEGYKPKVTAVIISKRILTRARPVDSRDGVGNNCNVPPGTTIDSIITHPSDLDYFQYGHKGIKGTSRPCHYYMVHDDNNLTTDQMAKISYNLCFIFERATSSTSAPAPVMHAHNLAFKARQWISSMDSKCDLRGLKGDERFKAEEKAARDLNIKFGSINADYATTSMFYI